MPAFHLRKVSTHVPSTLEGQVPEDWKSETGRVNSCGLGIALSTCTANIEKSETFVLRGACSFAPEGTHLLTMSWYTIPAHDRECFMPRSVLTGWMRVRPTFSRDAAPRGMICHYSTCPKCLQGCIRCLLRTILDEISTENLQQVPQTTWSGL